MKSFVVGLLASLLCGCAALVPESAAPPVLLHDSYFAPPSHPVSTASVFAVSDEMRRYLRQAMGDDMEAKGKERASWGVSGIRGAFRASSQRASQSSGRLPR